MTRRVPVLATVIVAAAVAAMLALGVWQLRKAAWKADLIAQYRQSQALSATVPWPRSEAELERSLFRWSEFDCLRVLGIRTTAATAADGSKGVAQIARCEIDGGGEAEVALGWSLPTEQVRWSGGEVGGIIGPRGILQATPLPSLKPLEPPNPETASRPTPEGHLGYAGQWFFFALTALAIYGLALRKRWRQHAAEASETN